MLPFLAVLIVSLTPTLAHSNSPVSKLSVHWWDSWLKIEIILALGIPLTSATTWLVRDYIAKDHEIARASLKEEIISSLQNTLSEANKEKDVLMSLKLAPIQAAIERLSTDYREAKLSDKDVTKKLEDIKKELYQLDDRLRELEMSLEVILSKLDSELSSILSNYTGESVKIRLLKHSFKND